MLQCPTVYGPPETTHKSVTQEYVVLSQTLSVLVQSGIYLIAASINKLVSNLLKNLTNYSGMD